MTKRVLVFGQSGVGKSSLINALANSKLPVSDKAVGTTFSTEQVSFVDNDSTQKEEIVLIDTIGLNESKSGTMSSVQSFLKLKTLLKKSTLGFNLMIFVTTKDRITETDKTNVELFKIILGGDKVPVIMVVNKSENLDCGDMVLELEQNGWVGDNLSFIDSVYGEKCFSCIKSTSFPDTKQDELMYSSEEKTKMSNASRKIVLSIIDTYSTKDSIVLVRSNEDLRSKLIRMWNLFLFKTGEKVSVLGIDLQSFSSVGKLAEKLKVVFKEDMNFLEIAQDVLGIGIHNDKTDDAKHSPNKE